MINVVTIMGTLLSFVGLVISVFTLCKTSNVEKAIVKQKIKQSFKNDYEIIYDSLNKYARALAEGDIKCQIFYDIHKCIKKLQHYSKIEKWDDCNEINDFEVYFDSHFSEILASEANAYKMHDFIKRLNSIIVILEKEGNLHDLRPNRESIKYHS